MIDQLDEEPLQAGCELRENAGESGGCVAHSRILAQVAQPLTLRHGKRSMSGGPLRGALGLWDVALFEGPGRERRHG
jgi:hypothetical protein